jgi:hypothetical protein
MKKVIRLTESDLVRLVKRVISEQEGTLPAVTIVGKRNTTPPVEIVGNKQTKTPIIDTLFDNKEQLEDEIEALANEIKLIRKQNIQNKKENIKDTLIKTYDKVIFFLEKTIRKLQSKLSQVRENHIKRVLEREIQELESQKRDLIKKRDELSTGKILSGLEKENLLVALAGIVQIIIPGAAILRSLRIKT